MKIRQLTTLALATLALVTTQAGAALLLTTDVYDPTGDGSNNIDTEDSYNDISLADFRTLVHEMYDIDRGGVINFDDLSDTELGDFEAEYGTNGTGILTVSVGDNNEIGSGAVSGWNVRNSSGSNGAMSDPKVLRGAYTWDFDFDTGLEAVAVTMVRRTLGGGTVDVTVELQDGTRILKSDDFALSTTNKDTFFAYEASRSNPIVSLELVSVEDEYNEVDELGFVVVPEPASLGLLVLGCVSVLSRRRRS